MHASLKVLWTALGLAAGLSLSGCVVVEHHHHHEPPPPPAVIIHAR
ncbi:MAG TPA: hypothetical protein VHC86_13740 [Opitutaceae bacterium]|nr:hypothetical protein [Opitutaceae bacterium]